jgi:hypothetical protein
VDNCDRWPNYKGGQLHTFYCTKFLILAITRRSKRSMIIQELYKQNYTHKVPVILHGNFSASLTNVTVPLPQSHDYSCYVSRRILAPPPPRPQKHTYLRAHDRALSRLVTSGSLILPAPETGNFVDLILLYLFRPSGERHTY